MSDISVQRLETLGMVILRGDMPRLSKTVGITAPPPRMIEMSDNEMLMWMAPDEALLLCDNAPERAAALAVALEGQFATVADVSDARTVFEVAGEGAEGAIAKLMPVDFANLAPNELRRTRLAQIAAALWQAETGWRIMCFRSVADYAEAALVNAVNGPIAPIPS